MLLQENKEKALIIYCSSIVFGIMAHGIALVNKYSFHDDASAINGLGATYSSGRWMLGFMERIFRVLFGSNHYSLPLFNGMIVIICIASIVFIISVQLQIESKILNILLSGIFVTFPAVTGIMGYMFTAPYYYLGALLGVIGAYILVHYNGWISILICSVFMACSTGVYQSNIPVCLSALLIFLIDNVHKSNYKWKEYIHIVVKNVLVVLLFASLYFIINDIVLRITKTQLTNYLGIRDYGKTTVLGYIDRIITAYKKFIYPRKMFPFNSIWCYICLGLIGIWSVVLVLKEDYNISKTKFIEEVILIVVFPLSAFFIYVMVDKKIVHGLMTFGEIFIFVLLVWAIEKRTKNNNIKTERVATIALITILIFSNIRYGNICNLKATFIQSQAINYYNTLETRIVSIEGYDNNIPVVYINEFKKKEDGLVGIQDYFDPISTPPYGDSSAINDKSWKEQMALWCGFNPIIGDATSIKDSDKVDEMPSYPDDGSIRIIGSQIVVKF